MKFFRNLFAAIAVLSVGLASTAAHAADVIPNTNYGYTTIFAAIDDITASSAISSTTNTDVPGVTVSVPASSKAYSKQWIKVCYFADVGKATATNGYITVFANGALITASARESNFAAGRQSQSICYIVARSSAAAQTVKLQYRSGDTNAFTIYNGQVFVEVLYVN